MRPTSHQLTQWTEKFVNAEKSRNTSVLRKSKFHVNIHQNPPLVPNQWQINPVYSQEIPLVASIIITERDTQRDTEERCVTTV
jgi:hypothetical protein